MNINTIHVTFDPENGMYAFDGEKVGTDATKVFSEIITLNHAGKDVCFDAHAMPDVLRDNPVLQIDKNATVDEIVKHYIEFGMITHIQDKHGVTSGDQAAYFFSGDQLEALHERCADLMREYERSEEIGKRKWAQEFPASYDVPDEVGDEFTDISWGNDASPSFEIYTVDDDNWARLWVDHPEPEKRETSGDGRYSVSQCGETDRILYAGDDLETALCIARGLREAANLSL